MKYTLYIDGSTFKSHIAIFNDEKLLFSIINEEELDTTLFLHQKIEENFLKYGLDFSFIDNIILLNGPGSYTGLRVALATAKGYCYATQIPLHLVNKLDLILALQDTDVPKCALLYARENEYYVCLKKADNTTIQEPIVLSKDNVILLLDKYKAKCFTLDDKIKQTMPDVISTTISINELIKLLNNLVKAEKNIVSLYDAEPYYLKEVYIL